MHPQPTAARSVLAAAVAALAFVLGPAGPARAADSIDEGLYREAPDLLNFLRDKGYQNVGVLKFRVKEGNRPETFNGGLLNTNLAYRLENALVLSRRDRDSLGIIHDATRVAFATDPAATYRTPEGRKRLFDLRYPLAWGTDRVQPDVFLAGIVYIGMRMEQSKPVPDPRATTVVIEAFDRTNPDRTAPVSTIEVKTDRMVLAEAGKTFRLSKSVTVVANANLEEKALANSKFSPVKAGNAPGGAGPDAPPPEPSPVRLTMLYNGQPQPLQPALGNGPAYFTAPNPPNGTQVTFELENTSPTDRLAVVLLVNGVSTLNDEPDGPPASMKKWVLQPGGKYLVEGYYIVGKENRPITVVSADDFRSRFPDFAQPISLGLVTLHVLREEPRGADFRPDRGLHATLGGARAATPQEARDRLKNARVERGKGVMAPGQATAPADLSQDPFPGGVHVETRIIRYFGPGDK